MRITVFTSNQPRHISLIEGLAEIADEIFAVVEASTIFPGRVADNIKRSDVMQKYFENVIKAEKEVFGAPRFLPKKAHSLILKNGDLTMLDMEALKPCLSSDIYVVFGSSYIKGSLIDFLVSHKAYNVHMGVSPYYRGSACNFWASYDGNHDYIGATIHLLSKGLDSGKILFHVFPEAADEPFLLGMKAVKSAHKGLIENLKSGALDRMKAVAQDKTLEVRYTRTADFTDDIADSYLKKRPSSEKITSRIRGRDLSKFVTPYIG